MPRKRTAEKGIEQIEFVLEIFAGPHSFHVWKTVKAKNALDAIRKFAETGDAGFADVRSISIHETVQ